ncbi:ATP-binding protein [Radicibacter daui]|uniref:ATP-binding protein n=1 Tax=Radicibacter daui TaxID=3064829 RepID=UPI004046E05F
MTVRRRLGAMRVSRILQTSFLIVALLALVPAAVSVVWSNRLTGVFEDVATTRFDSVAVALDLDRTTEVLASRVSKILGGRTLEARARDIASVEALVREVGNSVHRLEGLSGLTPVLRVIADRANGLIEVMGRLAEAAREVDATRSRADAAEARVHAQVDQINMLINGWMHDAADPAVPWETVGEHALRRSMADITEVGRSAEGIANRVISQSQAGSSDVLRSQWDQAELEIDGLITRAQAAPLNTGKEIAAGLVRLRQVLGRESDDGFMAIQERLFTEQALLTALTQSSEGIAEQLSGLARDLVDRTRQSVEMLQAQTRGSLSAMNIAMLLSGGLSALISVLVGWQYVGRVVIQRLDRLRRVMLAISRGHHSAHVPNLGARDEIGEMARTVEIFRRNAAELDMRNEELGVRARELRDLVNALSHARRQAETANLAKSQFLASMSHELRTPLNAIIGLSEMLIEELQDHEVPDAEDSLSRVVTAGRHLLALINDVLDLSKIEAGKIELYPETMPVMRACRDIVETVRPLAQRNGNQLLMRATGGDPGTIVTDPVRFGQTLMNLLANACKFTEKGTVTLDIRREGERMIVFEVQDTGIGIKPENLEKLFRDFSQAEPDIARRFGGTGLGLSISRRFARMMGGDVSVASVFGEGSTFSLMLPVEMEEFAGEAAAEGASETLPLPPPTRRAGQEREAQILFAEPEPELGERLDALAGRLGLTADRVADGLTALDHLRSHVFAAVFVSAMVQRMDPWSLMSAIMAEGGGQTRTPFLFYGVQREGGQGIAFGAAALTETAADRERLAALVRGLDRPQGNVLLVQSTPAEQQSLGTLLAGLGWVARTAVDARDAADLLMGSDLYDLCVVDIGHEETDGITFIEAVRADDRFSLMPIIVTASARVMAEERQALVSRIALAVERGSTDIEVVFAALTPFIAPAGLQRATGEPARAYSAAS